MTQQREIIIVMRRNQISDQIVAERATFQSLTRMTNMLFRSTFGLVILALLLAINPAGVNQTMAVQDDPFASPAQDPFGTPDQSSNPFAQSGDAPETDTGQDQPGVAAATLQPINPGLSKADQLVVLSVRESAPKTDLDLARAIRTLMDISQWSDANVYLSQLSTQCNEDQRMFILHQQMGPDFFLVLSGQPDLQPTGREFARRIFAASKRAAFNPQRINELILQLNDSNKTLRSNAFRALRRLGEPAMAALLNVLSDEAREEEYPGVRGAVRNFGFGGLEALRGAVRSDNQTMREEAVRGLAFIDRPASTDALLWAYRNPQFAEPVRRSALDALNQRISGLDFDVADQRLYTTSYQLLTGERNVAAQLLDEITLWNWNAQANQLQSRRVASATATKMAAADRARDLYELNPTRGRHRTLFIVTQLEAAKRISGPSVNIDPVAMQQALSKQQRLSTWELETALNESLRLNLMPAAAGACEMLGHLGGDDLIGGDDGKNQPLIKALQSGDRHVQFAAFQAISKLDPQTDFYGSSYMTSFAVYVASSEATPKSVVGHLRLDIAQSFASVLAQAGVPGLAASSSRDLYRMATQDPDVEVILITDTLDYPRFAELAQQLRADWRTRRMPIGLVLNDQNNRRRIQHILDADDRLMALPMTLDPALVAGQVQRLKSLEKTWMLSIADRRTHALAAIQWISKISGQKDLYPFYNFGDHQNTLTQLLYTPGITNSMCEILAQLSTPLAQRELVNFASQVSLPLDSRRAAADAFSKSLAKSGALLTRAEIMMQYDRYNASEDQPKESQQILASILDAIESRAKSQAGSN